MDPDEALAELRSAIYILKTILDGGEIGSWWVAGWTVVDLYEALDEWLTNGGFMPTEWRKSR